MDKTHSFGYWVRRQRLALDLTQAALAQRVGCAAITIRKIEADERRPSRQMAERLAQALTIPELEAPRFVAAGLGERPADVLPLAGEPLEPDATPPTWLREASPPAPEHPFVGREAQLARMAQHLDRAPGGEGRVIFVRGEAGQGKTALLGEFARRAQEARPQLLVVAGRCSTFGGQGDPYLPFRDILSALYGDLEGAWRSGRVTSENADRLWRFWPRAVQALLEQAPALAGTMLGRRELSDRAEAYGRGQRALAQRLQRWQEEAPAEGQHSAIHEQFARLMQALAVEQPMLLLLDDLQWADSASLHLLFHLGHRIGGSRVLLAGAYRPTDAGLADSRPAGSLDLRRVVQELTRRFGDIVVDLDHFDPVAGRQFVDALVDGEVNDLDDAFRTRLFWHTRGHPLFTVELLRELRERGDLRQAADGAWRAGDNINWATIPARVEAVIEQRLARLPASMRDLLAVASVEGETFTPVLLASIEGIEERDVLRRLAVLQHEYRLVRERGEIVVGAQRLAQYQFSHILFQQYLYHRQLSHAQRRHLHGVAGDALEALCQDHSEAFVVALAHHFAEAEEGEKAIRYLLRAGDQSRAIYAHREAIEHYRRALAFLKAAGDWEGAARALMKLGLTYHTAFDYEQARQAYEEGFVLWQQRKSGQMSAEASRSKYEGTLRLNWQQPTAFDPTLAPGLYSNGLASQLFSGLVALTPDLDVLPDVAQRWDVEEGGRRYIFHLRPDARWSDGEPVTAEDFVYSWRRALHPMGGGSLSSILLYDVRGAQAFHRGETDDAQQVAVSAPEAHTLVVELEEPTAYFPHLVAFPALFPAPRHVVQSAGADWTRQEPLVSNGPFTLRERRAGTMRLVRNPFWHGHSESNVGQIELTTLADPQALWQMYRDDALDVLNLSAFPPAIVDRARHQHADEYLAGPQLLTYYLAFNVGQTPFADRRVRRALALAADRAALANVALNGALAPPSGGFVPPGMPGYAAGIALAPDATQARSLLAEAGFPGGKGFPAIECLMRSGRAYLFAPLMAQWREKLGVEIVARELPAEEVEARSQRGAFTLVLSMWIPDYPDPDCYLRVCMDVDATGGGWQHSAYRHLIREARRLTSQPERIQHYHHAEEILVQEVPILPLAYGRLHFLIKPWVRHFALPPMKQRFWREVVVGENEIRDWGLETGD